MKWVVMLYTQAEDDQERFDRMQKALLMANPESMSFYNAQMRTQRRVCYCPQYDMLLCDTQCQCQ